MKRGVPSRGFARGFIVALPYVNSSQAIIVMEAKQLSYKRSVEAFEASRFEPSIWRSNSHFQTIVGTGALTTKIFGLPNRPFEVTKERFETVDNDFFDVEYTKGFDSSDKSVIIVHGLESNIQGRLVTNFATAFISKGFSCCLFSFRSCNGEENR